MYIYIYMLYIIVIIVYVEYIYIVTILIYTFIVHMVFQEKTSNLLHSISCTEAGLLALNLRCKPFVGH